MSATYAGNYWEPRHIDREDDLGPCADCGNPDSFACPRCNPRRLLCRGCDQGHQHTVVDDDE